MGHRSGFTGHKLPTFPAQPSGAGPIDPKNFTGFSYLFGLPPAASRTTIGQDPATAREILHALHLLLPLAQPRDNFAIPAGYTYLLQFLAHDLVETTVEFWAAADAGLPSRNMRDEALALDTLYGGGPAACPVAFAPAGPLVDLRTKLRLGRIGDADRLGLQGGCPFRDLARLKETTAAPPSNLDDPSQVYLADARNDDNTLVSQITVLFSVLHNAIADRLDGLSAQARFTHASVAVLTMYHQVIARDLMARLLHPRVFPVLYQKLAAGSGPWLWQGQGIPLEFSHGAFRVGHAMVRPFYQLNATTRIIPEELMGGPVIGDTVRRPLPASWIVEWARFFELGMVPNYAMKLGIRQQMPVDFDALFAPVAPNSPPELTMRDWLSAANARTWRADALIDQVRAHYPDAPFLPAGAIRQWLDGLVAAAPRGTAAAATVAANAGLLATDLPLPLYVLLEAQLDPVGDGQWMGPLGSVIVGEVIFRHLAMQQDKMADLVPRAQAALGGTWDKVRAVGSMPDLVRLAGELSGLDACTELPFIS